MAAYQEIHQALTQSIIDLALGLPLSYENKLYDPEVNQDEQYIEINILFNDQESLDKMLYDEVTGILQLSLLTRSETDIAKIISKVDQVALYYKHGLKIINGSQCVMIVNFGRNNGRNASGWYRVDMSISFKSDIAR